MRTVDADKLMERAKMHSIMVSTTLGHFDYGMTLGMLNEIVKECETSAPVGDMVSRKTVLNLLSTMPQEEAITRAMLVQSVKQMSAAQPEKRTEERTETHARDCISRKAAIEAIKEDKIDLTNPNVVAVFKATGDFEKVETQVMTCDRHIEILKDLPPERKHGKWIIEDNPGTGWYRVTCSECGEDVTSTAPCIGFYPNAKVTWDYCPNCGADMRGEADE